MAGVSGASNSKELQENLANSEAQLHQVSLHSRAQHVRSTRREKVILLGLGTLFRVMCVSIVVVE